jgi:predicted ester cyclase
MTPEENKTVVRRYIEEFHTDRALEILEQTMAPDLLEWTRESTERLSTAFPDYRFTIGAQVAEGDLVATVWPVTGTHEGEWASPVGTVQPTGRPVT